MRQCLTMSDKMSKRISTRVDDKTKKRLEKVATGFSGVIDESTLVRLAILKFLPEIEAGRLDLRELLKDA